MNETAFLEIGKRRLVGWWATGMLVAAILGPFFLGVAVGLLLSLAS